ncbi:MAG: hypothetical protein ACI9T8_000105 [Candidatus Saccharimonadales bacterium]|jgi:hypothetical protein
MIEILREGAVLPKFALVGAVGLAIVASGRPDLVPSISFQEKSISRIGNTVVKELDLGATNNFCALKAGFSADWESIDPDSNPIDLRVKDGNFLMIGARIEGDHKLVVARTKLSNFGASAVYSTVTSIFDTDYNFSVIGGDINTNYFSSLGHSADLGSNHHTTRDALRSLVTARTSLQSLNSRHFAG